MAVYPDWMPCVENADQVLSSLGCRGALRGLIDELDQILAWIKCTLVCVAWRWHPGMVFENVLPAALGDADHVMASAVWLASMRWMVSGGDGWPR